MTLTRLVLVFVFPRKNHHDHTPCMNPIHAFIVNKLKVNKIHNDVYFNSNIRKPIRVIF